MTRRELFALLSGLPVVARILKIGKPNLPAEPSASLFLSVAAPHGFTVSIVDPKDSEMVGLKSFPGDPQGLRRTYYVPCSRPLQDSYRITVFTDDPLPLTVYSVDLLRT